MKCFLYLIQIFEIRQLGFDQLDGERHFFSPTGGAMLKWWRPLNWAMWKIQQETQTDFKKEQGIRANHYWFKNLLKCQVKMGYILNIASGSEANMTTLCEMEFFNFLWLIWVHYLPLPPT